MNKCYGLEIYMFICMFSIDDQSKKIMNRLQNFVQNTFIFIDKKSQPIDF